MRGRMTFVIVTMVALAAEVVVQAESTLARSASHACQGNAGTCTACGTCRRGSTVVARHCREDVVRAKVVKLAGKVVNVVPSGVVVAVDVVDVDRGSNLAEPDGVGLAVPDDSQLALKIKIG